MNVFLLHGLGGNAATLYPMAGLLKLKGHTTYLVSYDPDQPTLDAVVLSAHHGMLAACAKASPMK